MRKIIAAVVVAGGLLFAGVGGMPVQAEGNGPSICKDLVPGEIVSDIAVNFGPPSALTIIPGTPTTHPRRSSPSS